MDPKVLCIIKIIYKEIEYKMCIYLHFYFQFFIIPLFCYTAEKSVEGLRDLMGTDIDWTTFIGAMVASSG